MSEQANKCCEQVYQKSGNWGHFVACAKKGKYLVNGKWFCGVHNPEAVAKRQKASNQRYEAKNARWNAKFEAERLEAEKLEIYPRLVEAMQEVSGWSFTGPERDYDTDSIDHSKLQTWLRKIDALLKEMNGQNSPEPLDTGE